MTCHYPDLGSTPDWLIICFNPSTTQLCVVTHHQCGNSPLLANTSFRGETSGGVAKSRLFSQAKGIHEFLTTFHALLEIQKFSRLSKYHGMSDTFATYMVR